VTQREISRGSARLSVTLSRNQSTERCSLQRKLPIDSSYSAAVGDRVYIEVTNTLAMPFTSGFQRHTREMVRRLPAALDRPDDPVITPVRWCQGCAAHLRLDVDELPDQTVVHSHLGLTAVPHRAAGVLRRSRRFREQHDPRIHRDHADHRINPRVGDIWLDLEAAWTDPASRAELLPELRAQGVTTAPLIADVMPERHPEWFRPATVASFGRYLRAHLEHSDDAVTISRSTTDELLDVARRLGRTRAIRISEVTMGADFTATTPPVQHRSPSQDLVCVGSLEARKNQALALDVFDELRKASPDLRLVLVGRRAFGSDELIERIVSHPDFGRRLIWHEHLDDDGLEQIYADAFVVLVPSFWEGFGIPVIEAMSRGVPVISSDRGALAEVGAGRVEFLDPTATLAWVTAVERHLLDTGHHAGAVAALADFVGPSWHDAARQTADAIRAMSS